MPFLRLILTDDDLASIRAAALARRLSVAAWARSELVDLANKAAPAQPASIGRKVDVRTAERYANLKRNLAENGRTFSQWLESQMRQQPSKDDRIHIERMITMYEAEQEG